MVLKAIVEHKRAELDARFPARKIHLEGVAPSERSLEDALRKPHTGFVLECKKASPSKGLIREDFDPAQIARAYGPFADAISVLTDEKYFQGSLDYLSVVREQVDVPVLCKDFVLEPFQVVHARKAGADAILLMMSVLSDEEFTACFEMTKQLSMDALVEVRDEPELARALRLGARIIGINNRNLDDLSVDLSATEKLAPLVPGDKVLISESGIFTHGDVRRLRPLVDGFLVGSSLMSKDNITRACGELLYGKVKVCGLRRREDALFAAARGIRFGGLIFAKKSPRFVDIKEAQTLRLDVPLDWVGVFVDAPPTVVADVANHLQLHAVQLHGVENEDYLKELIKVLPGGVEIWKALSVKGVLPDTAEFADCRLLYDGKTGGSGQPFNWSLLDGVDLENSIVAGGLTRDNAATADGLGAYALDVNSGIESIPGHKKEDLLIEFLAELRGVGRSAT